MPRFERKPSIVEAVCLPNDITIHYAEGDRRIPRGDYLVIGIEGDIYGVSGETFARLYKPADEQAAEHMRSLGRKR